MGRKKGVEFDEAAPDDFDPSNPYKDPVAMLEMREHIVREKWIAIEKAKILREKLQWCYRIEGVNHLQKCRHLVQQYLDATRGIGWGKDHRPLSLHGPLSLSLSLSLSLCIALQATEFFSFDFLNQVRRSRRLILNDWQHKFLRYSYSSLLFLFF
jgi:NADH dehydrogenase (ubiquinone) 1 beta subcomplex subunit 10